MKQLAFRGLGARANVVEGGDGDTAFADLGSGALDDALPRRLALGCQLLDLQVHFRQRTSGPMSPNTKRLEGRTALVTGSTGGLGVAIASALAAEGAFVVVSGRDKARGDAVVADIRSTGGAAEFVVADLGAGGLELRRLAEQAAAAGGGGGGHPGHK